MGRLALVVLACLGPLAACGGTSSPQPLDPAAPGPGNGTPTTTGAPAKAAAPSLGELKTLWESTLAVLAASPDQRPALLAPLAGRVPANLDATARALQPLQARTLASRASYQVAGTGRAATIADCAASSSPSVLGGTTAGFRAEASRADPAGPWAIGSVTLVPFCVPRADAEAALAAYNAFHAAETRLWADLNPADPALGLVTAAQRATLTAAFDEHRRNGWREQRAFDHQTVEVVGLADDGSVRLDLCTAFSADSGVYRNDQRLAGSDFPGQWHQQARMVHQEEQWLFDGYSDTAQGCLFAPTDKAAALL